MYQRGLLLLVLLFLLYAFHLKTQVEVIGEKGIIIIIRIIRAGTTLVSSSFNFSWNPKPKIDTFWIPAKVEEITDERGTSADYFDYSDYCNYTLFT